jgi:hypothetical protein
MPRRTQVYFEPNTENPPFFAHCHLGAGSPQTRICMGKGSLGSGTVLP